MPHGQAMSAADFASYRGLILGDPTCVYGTSPLVAPTANRGTWGPVANGNVIVIGTDPVYHSYLPGAVTLINNGIKFAADELTKTGLYADMSCYYDSTSAGTPVGISILQAAEQPSPFSVLPSSHSSGGSSFPFPQRTGETFSPRTRM